MVKKRAGNGRINLRGRGTKKPRVSRTEAYLVNLKYMGPERTEFPSDRVLDRSEYATALNWYNVMASADECRDYMVTLLEQAGRPDEARRVRRVQSNQVNPTAAAVARLASLGAVLPDSALDFFEKGLTDTLRHEGLETSLNEGAEVVPVPRKPVADVASRLRDKMSDYVGELHGLVDDGVPEGFSLQDKLRADRVSVPVAKYVARVFRPYAEEAEEACTKNADAQLVAGYTCYSPTQRRALATMYRSWVDDAERYAAGAKRPATTRKKRPVSVEKKLKRFVVARDSKEYGVTSVEPARIIGASEVWLLNAKYGTLTLLRAESHGGVLDVRGKSIVGYDENLSWTRPTGRKTQSWVDRVVKGTRNQLSKVATEMKSAPRPATPRCSENVLVLRVFSD